MFRGKVLDVMYYDWHSYRIAWNKAVIEGKLYDKNGRKITKKI